MHKCKNRYLSKKDYDPLNSKQRAFCDAYLISGDEKQAALEVGYSPKADGCGRMLKMPKIVKYLKTKRSMLDEKLEKGFKWKIDRLTNIIDRILGESPDSIDKQFVNSAISTIAEHNKMCGHYAPSTTIQVNLNDDPSIKRLKEVTNQILEEKRNARQIEQSIGKTDAKKDGNIT
jgi:phage terminase small subunit